MISRRMFVFNLNMIKWLLVRSVMVALLFTSCQNEGSDVVNGPVETKLITIQATSFETSGSDNWVIVHDENGALVAFKNFEDKSVVTVSADHEIVGNIGITLITFSTLGGYQLATYFDVEQGKELVLTTEKPASWGSFLGSFFVRVSGVSAPDQHALSSAIGKLDNGAGLPGSITFNGSIYGTNTKFLVQASDGPSLRYKFLDNVKPNDVLEISFSDMPEFDNVVEFNFPETTNVTLKVDAFDNDPALQAYGYFGFCVSNHSKNDVHSKIRAGYLSELTKYETRLTVGYDDYAYQYVNYGSIPDPNITWPVKSNFTIDSKSVDNFSATTTASFVRRFSMWATENGKASWTVLSPSNKQNIVELPSELTSMHPELTFDKFVHQYTSFVTKDKSYQENIDMIFEGKAIRPSEVVAITVYK
jgi:hypothetical protein